MGLKMGTTNVGGVRFFQSGGSKYNFTGNADKMWAGMAKALVDGTYTSGSVTYTTAFPNTWETLLDTGLTVLEGFCAWLKEDAVYQSGQQCNMYTLFNVREDGKLNFIGVCVPLSSANGSIVGKMHYNLVQETNYDSSGLNGAIRINGGVIEYKGRYNKNANYQIFPTNKVIEWIAW